MPCYDRFELCNAIERYVINSKYRDILRLKYCEGYTFEEVAEMTNYSVTHVKRICKEYKELLMNRI